MKCRTVRTRLSSFLDGDLAFHEARGVAEHLEACLECRKDLSDLRLISEAVGQLPRVTPPVSIASEMRDRLDVESRGPGLALLFRPAWRARPLMLPSLVPAAFLLVASVSAALILDRGPDRLGVGMAWESRLPASGTEGNPLFPALGISAPRSRAVGVPAQVLADMAEGTVFLETVVARDGSVSSVSVLGGNGGGAEPLVAALRRERYWPGRRNGRPVAVSVYRLISRVDVYPPLT
jgi:anti-sigma factor RsiW